MILYDIYTNFLHQNLLSTLFRIAKSASSKMYYEKNQKTWNLTRPFVPINILFVR